ncbi:flagellar assembly protein FliW [Syntrophomonas palmitatica]|uniref:flagellar assembly protein FliW n=1 Tax=Syntrophomonas palmitatica TaxID=402877 RepID=UPI0006CFE61C|nr:flagellar assembly protein FliW [Syntrophomonas palmitatica]
MKIDTVLLGEIEVEEQFIIDFPEGIPAFEEEKRFILLPMGEAGPFYYLQAVDNKELCLLLADPFAFFTDYEVSIPDEELAKLNLESENRLFVYTVVTLPDDFKLATTNLMAPIIIDPDNRKGMQYVPAKSKYSTRHMLFAKSREQNLAASAGEGR